MLPVGLSMWVAIAVGALLVIRVANIQAKRFVTVLFALLCDAPLAPASEEICAEDQYGYIYSTYT